MQGNTSTNPSCSGPPQPHVVVALKDVSTSVGMGERRELCAPSITHAPTNGTKLSRCKKSVCKIVRAYLDSYVWLMLSSSVGAALTFTSFKILSEEVSVFQVTTVRAVFSCVSLFGVCWWKGLSPLGPREKLPLTIARGVTGSAGFVCVAIATFKLPLSESGFMSNSYPVVTAVLSWLFGMENLGVATWSGVLGCIVGNALVAHPPCIFGGMADWGTRRLTGLGAAFVANLLTGAAFILIRYIGNSVNSISLTASLHFFSIFVSLPFLILSYPKPLNLHVSPLNALCYATICASGVLGQLAQSRALQIGPPTKTTTLYMTNMLLTGLIGVLAFSESMSWISALGAAVILVSVMLVTLQDSSLPTNGSEGYQRLLSIEDGMDEN